MTSQDTSDVVVRLLAKKVQASYGVDRVDILVEPSALEVEAAALISSLVAENERLTRQCSAALGMLRHLDDEIARVPAKPDPVTLNNLTYYAACLRTALSLDTKEGKP